MANRNKAPIDKATPPRDVIRLFEHTLGDSAVTVSLAESIYGKTHTRQLSDALWRALSLWEFTPEQLCSDKMCRFYLYFCNLPPTTTIHSLSVSLRRSLKNRIAKEGLPGDDRCSIIGNTVSD